MRFAWFRLLILMAMAMCARGQAKTSALTGVSWPPLSGPGTPMGLGLPCDAAHYGMPAINTSTTPNATYHCGSGGWQQDGTTAPIAEGGGVWSRQGTVITGDNTSQFAAQEASLLFEGNPQILTTSGMVFKVWYTCGWIVESVCYRESTDAINWSPSMVVIASPSAASHGYVFHYGSTYYAYEGNSATASTAFSMYTSSDGITWTLAHANVITAGVSGSWEVVMGNIYVIPSAGTWYAMYDGNAVAVGPGVYNIGVAISADQGVTWTKYSGNPVITGTGQISPDGSPAMGFSGPEIHSFLTGTDTPCVVASANCVTYVWAQNGVAPTDLFRWHSSDFFHWTLDLGGQPALSRLTQDEGINEAGGQVADPSMVEVGGKIYMLHDGLETQNFPNIGNNGIHLKLSTAPMTFQQLLLSQEGNIPQTAQPLPVSSIPNLLNWASSTAINNADLNNVLACGIYTGASLTNGPPAFGADAVRLQVICDFDGNNTIQIAYDPQATFANSSSYIRTFLFGTWTAWEFNGGPRAGNVTGIDMNTLTACGDYSGAAITNGPSAFGSNSLRIHVFCDYRATGATETIQVVWEPVLAGVSVGTLSYMRYFNSSTSTWSPWLNNGGSNAAIISGQDLNTIVNCGYYDGSMLTNAPSAFGSAPVHVQVVCGSENNSLQQIAYDGDGISNAAYIRGDDSGTWGPWVQFGVLTASITTTAATSDVVAIPGMTSAGHCGLGATNAIAATNLATTYISAKATNQITLTHAATAGMTYDAVCGLN
jgi:hypothetical protein